MNRTEVILTDSEWMSLLDGERESGLQRCCANISELRDIIYQIVREGCEVSWIATQYLRAYRTVLDGHTLDNIPALQKLTQQVLDACGYTWDQLKGMDHGTDKQATKH